MKRLNEYRRCGRLIESIISSLKLDLRNIRVLTETGSGAFVLTPLIAAMAGAEEVIAVTSDSPYGSAKEVMSYTRNWSEVLGVSIKKLRISECPSRDYAETADLVTNLGFVRPLDACFLSRLPENAAISLMWEPWEFRSVDLDLEYCRTNNIPVLGTNERDGRLQIFKYVGLLAIKLLFEAGLEVYRSKVLVIGSGVFGTEVTSAIENSGGMVIRYDPTVRWPLPESEVAKDFIDLDAVIVVENQVSGELVGDRGISPELFLGGVQLIHICGNINHASIEHYAISKFPERRVGTGYMTVTTDYLGPRPVIDLHAAGLKVGECLVHGMRKYGKSDMAVAHALKNSPALDFDTV